MKEFSVKQTNTMNRVVLPTFSIEIDRNQPVAIYSDVDLQTALVEYLTNEKEQFVYDCQDGLYERLSVKDHIIFFKKWFSCSIPLRELLVMFDLQDCATKPLRKCLISEARRVYYAKYYMMQDELLVFQEPISGVNIKTINIFLQLLQQMQEEERSTVVLVSTAEQALLLSECAYHLRSEGLQQLEVEQEVDRSDEQIKTDKNPIVEQLFKIPAKVDDKVILFDPPEIDFIESHSGKAFIYVHNESFPVDLTLTEMEEKLELYGFYRCHRSYIVNLQKVREIITWSKNTYSLRINNSTQSTIPLSRTKLHVIQEIFKLK